MGKYYVHITLDIVLCERNGHILPAYYVRRAQKYGIAQFFRRRNRVLLAHNGYALGTGYSKLLQKRVKPFPVLGKVNAVGRRSEYTHALFIEVRTKFYSRLSAKSYNHAVRLFNIYYVLHVFRRKRFKIKPVRRVKVRGNGFGVVVNYNYFVTHTLQRPHTMNRRIIELYSLTNAYRSRTYYYNPLFLAVYNERLSLVVFFFIIRRIEIRRLRGKFRSASINHFKHRVSVRGQFVAADSLKSPVGVAQFFAAYVLPTVDCATANFLFVKRKIFKFI